MLLVLILNQKIIIMKYSKLKVVLVALVCILSYLIPNDATAQPRQHQGSGYQQGYDDVYRQRGRNNQRGRGRMYRRPAPRSCFVTPPPPMVRHRRMVRRMASRHFCRMCAPSPRYSHRCR